jgi:hypothetical protein
MSYIMFRILQLDYKSCPIIYELRVKSISMFKVLFRQIRRYEFCGA